MKKVKKKRATRKKQTITIEQPVIPIMGKPDTLPAKIEFVETSKHEATIEKKVGILCPSCRFEMRVYKTKKLTGEIARERICDRCGTRKYTDES